MKLGLTIFIWIVVIYLILISLAYVVAIVGTIVLAVKGKKDRKEFYKRNRHITKDFDKHFKE
ncbi:hypothetical protein QJ729_05305 [Staphylococcus hominis]|uniref:hypothetical protein n=1 Tax=Staphylococcus hominis TaxID=1290 RepID=UPI0034CF1D9B